MDNNENEFVAKGGPYIQAACFCEMAFPDNTGCLSIIKIIDNITITSGGQAPPKDMPAIDYKLTLVLMLKSGKARGRSEVMIRPELPNGSSLDPQIYTVHFDGEEKGVNMILSLMFKFTMEGLHLFWVYLDEKRFTAIPLKIMYDRRIIRPPTQPGLPK
jgi:hypothetical protein